MNRHCNESTGSADESGLAIGGSMARRSLCVSLRVKLVDLRAVFFFDRTAPQLEAGGKLAGGGAELVGHQDESLNGLELCAGPVQVVEDALIKSADSLVADQLRARCELDPIGARPIFQKREVRRDDGRHELAAVA